MCCDHAGGTIGGGIMLAFMLYGGARLYRYRKKYHDQRAKAKDLEETVEEMQIVGGQVGLIAACVM